MIKVLLKRTLEEGKVEFYEVTKESYRSEYGDELYRVELEDFELTPDTAKEGDRVYCIERQAGKPYVWYNPIRTVEWIGTHQGVGDGKPLIFPVDEEHARYQGITSGPFRCNFIRFDLYDIRLIKSIISTRFGVDLETIFRSSKPYTNLTDLTDYVLSTGNRIRIFLSGGRLRIARSVNEIEGSNKVYGEGPNLNVALNIANDNVIDHLTYAEKFLNFNAKYPHFLTGDYSSPNDYLDRSVWDSTKFEIFKTSSNTIGVIWVGYSGQEIEVSGKNIPEALSNLSPLLKRDVYGL